MSKVSFDVKSGVEDSELLFVFSGPMIKDFGSYLGPVSPDCPNAPNTLKQVKLNPQMATILE